VTNGTLTSMQGSSTTYIAPKIAGDYQITLTPHKLTLQLEKLPHYKYLMAQHSQYIKPQQPEKT